MARFTAKLEPSSHGGHYVLVPAKVAESVGLKHGARVRGSVNDVAYRSSLMKYSGKFHLGVHKATALGANVSAGDRVSVTIELDDQPLPTDTVPSDLARALARQPKAAATWKKLAPAVRRGYVKSVIDAKREETRARRVASIVGLLRAGVPKRRTWTPR